MRPADSLQLQVVCVLAGVDELDHDEPGGDPQAREREPELLRDDLHAGRRRRRRSRDHRIRVGLANDAAPGMRPAASVPSHCSSSAA